MKVSKAEIIWEKSTSWAACGWGRDSRRLGTSSRWNKPSEPEDALKAVQMETAREKEILYQFPLMEEQPEGRNKSSVARQM